MWGLLRGVVSLLLCDLGPYDVCGRFGGGVAHVTYALPHAPVTQRLLGAAQSTPFPQVPMGAHPHAHAPIDTLCKHTHTHACGPRRPSAALRQPWRQRSCMRGEMHHACRTWSGTSTACTWMRHCPCCSAILRRQPSCQVCKPQELLLQDWVCKVAGAHAPARMGASSFPSLLSTRHKHKACAGWVACVEGQASTPGPRRYVQVRIGAPRTLLLTPSRTQFCHQNTTAHKFGTRVHAGAGGWGASRDWMSA